MPRGARAAALLAAGLALGCRSSPEPLRRLAFAERAPQPRQAGDETRPAFALRPGEPLVTEVQVAARSRLLFAWSLLDGAPRGGAVELAASVDGRVVDRRSVPAAGAAQQWWPVEVPIAGGRRKLEFRASYRAPPDTRRRRRRTEGAWVALAEPRLVAASATPRRVLVWISLDTVRADHVGAYGYARKTTPNLDQLAGEAVLFENAVATASWTLPSLASQFTSRYPTYHGAVLQRYARDPAHPTVFEVLAGSGFTVLGVTGNRFVSHPFRTASGFDVLRFGPGRAGELNGLVRELLGEWTGGDLALFVHYMDPHASYTPPAPYDTAFDPGYAGPVTGWNFESLGSGTPPADRAHVKALYDGELAYTDRMVGELLEALDARGLVEGAVLVVTADHGEEFLDHGGWTHSRTLYQEMLHVPFLLRVPGVSARREGAVVTLVDLAPTILDCFGLEPPGSFQGSSLLALLREGRRSGSPVVAETERNPEARHRVAVRSGPHKYVLETRRGRRLPLEILDEALYDLDADPGERAPLRDPSRLEALRRQALAYLSRARAEARPPGRARVAPEVRDELKALGYVQ